MSEIELTPIGAADHARGPGDAPLTLVEYGDFECPYCSTAHTAVAEIERRFAGRLRFVFRQFPLRQIHSHAEAAAEAAEAAGAQGKFWEMYDTLFAHQRALGADALRSYARAIGVPDIERFERELAREYYRPELDRAIEQAEASGVEGTPSFFINGQPFEDDPNVDALSAALEDALAEASSAKTI
jgi:protein-disulfide isomerase